MKKAIILLFVASIMLFGSSSCTQPRGKKLPATKEETIEVLKSLLREHGFASNLKNWEMEIDECRIIIEYEQDNIKHRFIYPTYGIDRVQPEEGEIFYAIYYQSNIATYIGYIDEDDEDSKTNVAPFMHVDAPITGKELERLIRHLSSFCNNSKHTPIRIMPMPSTGLPGCIIMGTATKNNPK